MGSVTADDVLDSAVRLLRHRDRATADLDRLLAERGFAAHDRADVIASLARTGVLDDSRFAANRARSLAERGAGDGLIRHDLTAAGVETAAIDAALRELDSESERASRVIERRGASAKTARYLAAKGYAEDVVRATVARGDREGLG